MEKISELNLREIIGWDKHKYNDFVKDYISLLSIDYHTKIRPYTYKPIEEVEESPFLKDEMIMINCDGEYYEATQGNALSLIILFTTLNKLHNRGYEIGDLNEFMFDPSEASSFENILDEIYLKYITYPDIKNIIFESVSQLARVSAMFVSGTISLRDIYMLEKNNPEFSEVLNFNIEDENESFATMIDEISENSKKLQHFLENTDSCYRPMIKSGSGFNFKQASQIFNLIGPKPDIFGNIHKHPILTNFLNGLTCVEDFYVNADNCRKALITNFTSVKDSGYLTRILSMLCLDTKLSETECCTTSVDNLPNVNITNEFILKKYKNRNMWDEETQSFRIIGMDKSLIGKTIKVASPMTCTCKDGICKTCYGDLYKTVTKMTLKDGRTVVANIGLIAVLLLTEVLTQMLLSTKHLLEAKTGKLDWKGLDKYFDIYSSSLTLKDKYPLSSLNILEFEDEDITKLSINGRVFETPVTLQLNTLDYKIVKSDEDLNSEDNIYQIERVTSTDGEEEVPLFEYITRNIELSDPLKKIDELLNTSKIKDRDIDGNLNYMMDLLNQVGFKISSEHIEVIMRELMDVKDRSTFELANPEYEFMGARSKVLRDSITKSLLFERLETQLLNINTYSKENKESLLDFLL